MSFQVYRAFPAPLQTAPYTAPQHTTKAGLWLGHDVLDPGPG